MASRLVPCSAGNVPKRRLLTNETRAVNRKHASVDRRVEHARLIRGENDGRTSAVQSATNKPTQPPAAPRIRAFGQQLAQQFDPAGAERDSNRHLAAAGRRTRDQKTRDVRARNQEDQRHRRQDDAGQHDDVAAKLRMDAGARKDEHRRGSVFARKVPRFACVTLCETIGDGLNLRLRLGERDTRPQARDDRQPAIARSSAPAAGGASGVHKSNTRPSSRPWNRCGATPTMV